MMAVWSCVLASLLGAAGAQTTTGALATFNPLAAANSGTTPAPGICSGGTAITAALNAGASGDTLGMKANENAAIAEVPEAAGELVQGFIGAYFARVVMQPGEKECIKRNSYVLVKDGSGLLTLTGQTIAQLVAKEAPNALGMISAMSHVIEIVTTVQNLAKGCVRADAVAVMNQTFAHLQNPQYVNGRFLANGIDIARVFADSIPAYEAGNFCLVGKDFGTLLRKILLSRNTGTVQMVLPEGMPKEEVGEAIVNGVVDGMFVEGTTMDIRNSVDASIDIHIDLHKCFSEEAKYFTAAANALYLAIAQITTNIEQWQLHQKGIQTGYVVGNAQHSAAGGVNGHVIKPNALGGIAPANMNLDWMNRLSGVMMNIPVLMARCNFTQTQENMMKKALKIMDKNELTFNIPGPANRVQAGTMASVKFAEAAQEWKVGHYRDFGFLLGGLMRDLLLTVFPQKYSVDSRGRLRDMDEEAAASKLGAGSFTLLVAGFAVFMVVGLSVVRIVRRGSVQESLLQSQADLNLDMEDGAVE